MQLQTLGKGRFEAQWSEDKHLIEKRSEIASVRAEFLMKMKSSSPKVSMSKTYIWSIQGASLWALQQETAKPFCLAR